MTTTRPKWPQKPHNPDKICTVEGCDRPQLTRGWCNVHYHRHRKYGSTADPKPIYVVCAADGCERPTANRSNPHCGLHRDRLRRHGSTAMPGRKPPKPKPECSAEGCSRPAMKRGHCRMHDYRLKTHGSLEKRVFRPEPGDPEERFTKATRWGEAPTYAPDLGPCLIYLGADNGNGYGQFHYRGSNGYAHRYAWERKHGPIPDGLTVDHLCRVRSCVNVDHMELVDGPTNTRRAAAVRTHCKNGHEFTHDNTRIRRGRRICLICDRTYKERSEFKRTLAYLGRPSLTIKYDQAAMGEVVAAVRRAEMTIAQGARQIGCNPNYLGRRVWEEAKRAVFERDKGCTWCGTVDQWDAHHRHARGSGGSANPRTSFGMDNLVTLCRTHHSEVEQNPDWARKHGLRVDMGQDPADVPVLYRGRWVLLRDDGSVKPLEGDCWDESEVLS